MFEGGGDVREREIERKEITAHRQTDRQTDRESR